MKKTLFILLVTLFFKSALSQSRDQKIENLYYSCKVWGLLKYYHPSITKGKCDWDNVLLDNIDVIKKCKTAAERDSVLLSIIETLPPYRKTKELIITDSSMYSLLPNYNWINGIESDDLRNTLNEITKIKVRGKHSVKSAKYSKVADFSNEKFYEDASFSDNKYSMLTLFRYWNMIEYFFPYKHLTDKEWDMVLREYIPRFLEINSFGSFSTYVSQLIAETNDSHVYTYSNKYGSMAFMAVMQNGLAGKKKGAYDVALVDSIYYIKGFFPVKGFPNYESESELKVNDVILEVDNKNISEIVNSYTSSFFPCSIKSNEYEEPYVYTLLSSNKDTIDVKIERDGVILDKKIHCVSWGLVDNTIDIPKTEEIKWLSDSVVYIPLDRLSYESNKRRHKAKKLKKSGIVDSKSIIIDIRTYPLNEVCVHLFKMLGLNYSRSVILSGIVLSKPGAFKYNIAINRPKPKSRKNEYKGKIIILAGDKSISQCETIIMILQSHKNSYTIGEHTMGANGNMIELKLPYGIVSTISNVGVYYPDGGQTQRVGVRIDEVIKPTIKGIREGRDEILERAIEIINEK